MRKMTVWQFKHSGKTHTVSGTAFQVRIWQELRKIPRGKVISYAGLARHAGRPRSARAAANACGANPLPVIVPCHRVIRGDGSLGGYSGRGGVRCKAQLLRREGYLT